MSDPVVKTYKIEGMTCDHCKMAVTSEVGSIDGAQDVSVDVESGTLLLSGDVSDEAVKAAVEEAGYKVV